MSDIKLNILKLADIHSDLEEVGENFSTDRPKENSLSGKMISNRSIKIADFQTFKLCHDSSDIGYLNSHHTLK